MTYPHEPPIAGDETATLLGSLERQRRTFEWKCEGLDADGLRATVGASSITLGGLLKHLALVEAEYFALRLHGRDLGPPWNAVDWNANPGWEWRSAADDAPDELYALWGEAVARSRSLLDEALAEGGLDQLCRFPGGEGSPSLRRVLIDLIEEYARHVGHADLIRESVDGLIGEDPPREAQMSERQEPATDTDEQTMLSFRGSGFAENGNARIYFEIAGKGVPFVMIHAGVADSRQWDNEFEHYASRFCVLRYDMRGYGRSEPVDGEYSHLRDLVGLLDHLDLDQPLILMGCSMGGGVAMNFALEHQSLVRALIMVDSGPPGLKLDLPSPPLVAEVEKAFDEGDLDRVVELETRLWFDGPGREPSQVDRSMRRLASEMNRTALTHEIKGLGKRQPDTEVDAVERLDQLEVPVLVVVGEYDTPYMLASADYMVERIHSARKVVLDDAAHLPNMDHPDVFQSAVDGFLADLEL